jgi:DNA-directed RNA polymerase subunit K/omega
LQSGARPLIDITSRKPCRIAMEEIRAGKVKWTMGEPRTPVEIANEYLEQALGRR